MIWDYVVVLPFSASIPAHFRSLLLGSNSSQQRCTNGLCWAGAARYDNATAIGWTSKFLPSLLVIGPLCRKVDINRRAARSRETLIMYAPSKLHRYDLEYAHSLSPSSPFSLNTRPDPRHDVGHFFFFFPRANALRSSSIADAKVRASWHFQSDWICPTSAKIPTGLLEAKCNFRM